MMRHYQVQEEQLRTLPERKFEFVPTEDLICKIEAANTKKKAYEACLSRFDCSGLSGAEITMEGMIDKTLIELLDFNEDGEVTIEEVQRLSAVLALFAERAKRLEYCQDQ